MFDKIKKFVKRMGEDNVLMSFRDGESVIAELTFQKTDNQWLHFRTVLHTDNLPVDSKFELTQIGIEEIKKYQG